MKSCKGTSGE